MNVILSDHNLRHQKVFGGQYIVVECTAELNKLVSDRYNVNHGKYNIEYHRNPISGELVDVTCKPVPESETTQNTLTTKVVEGHIWDHLQK